jgi:hypothetical protein
VRTTSFDELYSLLCQVVTETTGRRCWRKAGIQAQPVGTYATVYLEEAAGLEQEVVTDVELPAPGPGEPSFEQRPWGTSTLRAKVEFYRSTPNDAVLDAVTRFRTGLRLEARFWDLWEVCGLLGGTGVTDLSGPFRGDIEPRAEVRFQLLANVAAAVALAPDIHEIQCQEVNVTHVRQNGIETLIQVTEGTPEGGS